MYAFFTVITEKAVEIEPEPVKPRPIETQRSRPSNVEKQVIIIIKLHGE